MAMISQNEEQNDFHQYGNNAGAQLSNGAQDNAAVVQEEERDEMMGDVEEGENYYEALV